MFFSKNHFVIIFIGVVLTITTAEGAAEESSDPIQQKHEAIKNFVDSEITSNKIVVFLFAHNTSPTETILRNLKPDIKFIELLNHPDRNEIIKVLQSKSNYKEPPYVFANQKYFGDENDVKQQQLDKTLKSNLGLE